MAMHVLPVLMCCIVHASAALSAASISPFLLDIYIAYLAGSYMRKLAWQQKVGTGTCTQQHGVHGGKLHGQTRRRRYAWSDYAGQRD